MAGAHGPGQEGSQGLLLVVAVTGVPGVDVGLGDLGRVVTACLEPGQELLGVDELLASEPPSGRGEGPGPCFGAQPRELVPDAELAQEPSVRIAVELEFGEALVEPGLDVQQLLVDSGKHAAGHEQVAQVGDGPPVRQWVQRLVGQRAAPGRQVGQQLGDCGLSSQFRPLLGLPMVLNASNSGANAGLMRPLPSSRTAVSLSVRIPLAQPARTQQPLEPAPVAEEAAGDAGAVSADRHPVGAAAG